MPKRVPCKHPGCAGHNQDDIDLVADLIKAEQSGNFTPITVHFGPYTAFYVTGCIQLAWRHPGMTKHQADIAERAGRIIQAAYDEPVQHLIELGWHPGLDV